MIREQVRRMWINQPSRFQALHDLHGTNVLATCEDGAWRVWFLSGEMVSMRVPYGALSLGWVTTCAEREHNT